MDSCSSVWNGGITDEARRPLAAAAAAAETLDHLIKDMQKITKG